MLPETAGSSTEGAPAADFITLAVKVKVRSSIRKVAVYRGDPEGGHGKQE